MVFIQLPKFTEVSTLLFRPAENADCHIVSKEFGKFNDLNLCNTNAVLSMDFRVFGKTMDVKP